MMSQLGGSAFSAIKFLDLFFKDVSKLISVVEEEMKKNDLISSSGGASFWEQSTTHYTPEKWMPRYIVRHYVEKLGGNAKPSPDPESALLVFFNVYLAPIQIKEPKPIAVWGVGSQNEEKSCWDNFNKIATNKDGPDFLGEIPIMKWTEIDGQGQLKEFKYKAISVTELHNEQEVRELVIDPLLEEVKRLRSRK
jgi:hypothetical protein